MIVENIEWKDAECDKRFNSKFYYIILQYTTKINSDKIMKALRKYNGIGINYFMLIKLI
jgi:hypothetical protein